MECCAHHEIKIERFIVLYLMGGVLLIATRLALWTGMANREVAMVPAAIGAISF